MAENSDLFRSGLRRELLNIELNIELKMNKAIQTLTIEATTTSVLLRLPFGDRTIIS
jgi:hypothetical protein